MGSWYGDRPSHLCLGGAFHRSRMRLISSQVSTIAPRFAGRWSPARRREVAWRMFAEIELARLITDRFPVSRADKAYDLLDRRPQEAVQVMLTYKRDASWPGDLREHRDHGLTPLRRRDSIQRR